MIHPAAIVHEGAWLAESVSVWQFAHVMNGASIGEHASVGACTEIGRFSRIGDHTRIGYGCFLPNHTQVGSRVFIGPRVVMCDDKHPRSGRTYKPAPPVIEDDVSIGAGAVILPGVRLGRGCIVGAGAVVTRDVLPYTTVIGPAAHVLARQDATVTDAPLELSE
jgi:UDP-2-acetamido-3-amino-2,3-dideoxy-glucuronate N-acetyltransferase